VACLGLRAVLPLVATEDCADQREDRREAGIHATKWPPRAQRARPAGQVSICYFAAIVDSIAGVPFNSSARFSTARITRSRFPP